MIWSHKTGFSKNVQNIRPEKMELIEGGKKVAEGKIQRGIFQEDTLSPLLFGITMMPRNYIFRKWIRGNKFTKSAEKIMCMDDSKLFSKNEKELGTVKEEIRIYNQDIGFKFNIKNVPFFMYHAHNEKWKKANNGRNRTAKLGKN